MKKIFLFLASCFLITTIASATTNNSYNNTPFIFIENGVEYAVFRNGEFDFNIINPKISRAHINTNFINISFNSGRNYTPYIQRNQYGDIVSIENTPIYYDYNGRVDRIGNVIIRYNRSGYVQAIGNLNISYTNYGRNYSYTGYVNRINYHYQPRSRHYQRPTRHHHSYKAPNNNIRKQYSYNRTPIKKYPNRYYPNTTRNKTKSYSKKELKKQNSKKDNSYKERNSKKKESSNSSSYRKNSNSYRR
ncbi:hypothetical protein FHR24_002495 [Wenyingzhuangia heitensis]|uniref:Uncharacterized protein n=1 Tax=Wenyingzhuangia heitensis TaxID=1487859 RepID=A0ABX0UB15_9FLAO|nr:hypothetical protein [Wenyingzhuangia heitensis]NIJ46017.1 hypothetical protein [Wenyingzhuangia heitensis]